MKYHFKQFEDTESVMIRMGGDVVAVENGVADLDLENEAHKEIIKIYNGVAQLPQKHTRKKAGR